MTMETRSGSYGGHERQMLNGNVAEAVCAVIVSFRPDASCIACIGSVIATADHTVIVDNGSTGDILQHLQGLVSERATLLLNGRNLGIGAALNIGMRHSHELGFNTMLLLDHDTRPLPDAIAHLLRIRGLYTLDKGRQPGLVGAAYQARRADGSVEARSIAPGEPEWTPEPVVITSGTLIDWGVFSRIGPFREDFFIDHVDHEYCLRIRAAGYEVIRTTRPVAEHRIGNLVEVRSVFSLGRPRVVTNHSPLRRYYQARNLMLLNRAYGRQFPDFMKQQFHELRSQLRHVLKYEENRWAKLGAAISGLIDGWRGIAGERKA